MILLDADPPSKSGSYSDVLGPTVRYPDRVAGRGSTLTLPDYETSQALAFNKYGSTERGSKKRVDSRFWRATFYALLIYIAISVVIAVPLIVTGLRRHRRGGPTPGPPWHAGVQVSGPSSSMTLAEMFGSTPICNAWTPQTRDASGKYFVVSQSHTASPQGEFSLRSNVSSDTNSPQRIFGELNIAMNPDKKAKDAMLSISMQYSSPELSKSTNVCLSKNNNACDLSIYVPNNLSGSDYIHFSLSLFFPSTTDMTIVDTLATWLPMFDQNFGYMDTQLTFSKATIEGDSSTIDAKYVQADNLLVKTSLAAIKGNFRANGSLTLDTIDAPINASITLYNDWRRHVPTFLNLDTGNGYIDSDIHLIAPRPTDKSHAHTKFLTSVNTFNAPLKVSVAHDDSTPPSEFHLRAANNLAESHITLDPKYTGTFDLRTKLASAVVDRVDHDLDNEVDDSSKQRNFQYDTQTSTHMFGWVGFGQRPGPTTRHLRQGHVEIHSSHSQVLLQLQGAGVDSSRS